MANGWFLLPSQGWVRLAAVTRVAITEQSVDHTGRLDCFCFSVGLYDHTSCWEYARGAEEAERNQKAHADLLRALGVGDAPR